MPSDERYLTGLIGDNLSASLSPALHDGAYAALGLAGQGLFHPEGQHRRGLYQAVYALVAALETVR